MKVEAHTRYKNKEGKTVPGVTTIVGILAKPALIKWANNLGLKGIDSTKYVDEKAQIGALVHEMIMAYLKGREADTRDYSQAQIEQAENSLLSFFEWEKAHPLKPVLVETPLVSEEYGFGGTPDFYGYVDGQLTLIDFKTGSEIYREMLYQLGAYRQLLTENGYPITNTRILRIGRDADEGFEERVITDLSRYWEVFYHCLAIYNLQREMKA